MGACKINLYIHPPAPEKSNYLSVSPPAGMTIDNSARINPRFVMLDGNLQVTLPDGLNKQPWKTRCIR